jgi:branched-chain amino acid transport system substrate-binding protein
MKFIPFVLLLLLITACAAQKDTIKVGAMLPLSGEAANLGAQAKTGIDLAVQEINAAGGINGRMIEIIYEDDQCNAHGVNAMTKLVSVDDVDAVIGPICSAAGGPGLPVAQADGTPTIILAASAPHLTQGEYIFRVYPSDAFAGKFMAQYIKRTGKERVAVVYSKNDWGQGIRDSFVKEFTALGGQVIFEEGLPQDARDARTTVTKLQQAKPEMILSPMYPNTGVIFLKQLRDAGVNAPILAGDAFETAEVIDSGVADGVMLVSGKISNPDEFKAKVQAAGKESEYVTPLGYDAVQVLAQALRKSGTDKNALRAALQETRYVGISNPLIEFDDTGDLKSAQYNVKLIKNGGTEIIE